MDFSKNTANLPQLAFTHAGRFHADDVFSAALLRLLRPDIRIYRGFTVPKGFSGIVFDIGDGPFDHHQKGSPRRPGGAPYAAFGLLWREYGGHFLNEADAQRFDDKFIQPLDIDDNTGTGHVLANLIGAFNPVWDEENNNDTDPAFFEAVEVARQLLYHKLKAQKAIERGQAVVSQRLAIMKDNVVELEIYVPWKPVLVPSAAEFVISPSHRGGYSVQCIPKDLTGKTGDKIPMPAAWRGRPAEEIRRLSGVEDVNFCHASGFMATVGSLAGARMVCVRAREEQAALQAMQAAQRAAVAAAKLSATTQE